MSKQQRAVLGFEQAHREVGTSDGLTASPHRHFSLLTAFSRSKSLAHAVVFGPVEEVFRRANEVAGQAETPLPLAVAGGNTGPVGGWAKRCIDIAIAAAVLVLLSPLMLMVVLLIRINMGGPVIFGHARVGANGKVFRCYKFRTMVNNAEEILAQHLAHDPALKAEWESTAKLRNDPRVTGLGDLLRRSSIDELPQLFNVLKGDMSCVGPRPIVAAELAPYGEHASDYLAARPGLSGIWQVSGRNTLAYGTRVKLDALYVRSWSLLLDFAILLATIPAVLRRRETS